MPAPRNIPEPTTREAVMALLWPFLKERLKVRRQNGGVGVARKIPLVLPNQNSERTNTNWQGDVPLANQGRLLFAGLNDLYEGWVPVEHPSLPLLLDLVHDLARQGILRADGGSPTMYITHHGATVLDVDDMGLPVGSSERVVRLRAEFAGLPDLDLVARHYAEAIGAYEVGLDYSATVMIGVCYEAGLLLLARAITDYDGRAAGQVAGLNNRHRANLPKISAQDYVSAAALEDLAFDVLSATLAAGRDLQWVRTVLRPTCFFVRSLRNSAGHPTGQHIPRDDVAAHILMFPAFVRRVVTVRKTLAGLP